MVIDYFLSELTVSLEVRVAFNVALASDLLLKLGFVVFTPDFVQLFVNFDIVDLLLRLFYPALEVVDKVIVGVWTVFYQFSKVISLFEDNRIVEFSSEGRNIEMRKLR